MDEGFEWFDEMTKRSNRHVKARPIASSSLDTDENAATGGFDVIDEIKIAGLRLKKIVYSCSIFYSF